MKINQSSFNLKFPTHPKHTNKLSRLKKQSLNLDPHLLFVSLSVLATSNITYSVNGSHVPTHRHEKCTVHKVKDYLNIIIGQGTKAILYKLFEFGTQYVKIEWKKCQNMPVFAEQKWFWPSLFAQDDAEAGKRHSKA